MKHNNIAIFIPHAGCKNLCSFCNQNTISGIQKMPSINQVRAILDKASAEISDKSNTEIAFFGGSFTAIDREYMIKLLKLTREYSFSGVRLSTRPDCIDEEILMLLKQYNVTAIELGAQSMVDSILIANRRGHTAGDVINSSRLIKQYGFSLGLQMMVGLYKSDEQLDLQTADEFVKIHPDTVRIYPTVILKNTYLGELFAKNEYEVMNFDKAVSICAKMLKLFYENDINVIKLGLHASEDIALEMLGGIYHPAFRELCESEIYFLDTLKLLKSNTKKAIIYVMPSAISKMVGQKRENIKKLNSLGFSVTVKARAGLEPFEIKVEEVNA